MKAGGVKHIHLISSGGANANSWFLYTKCKGELEDEVKKLRDAVDKREKSKDAIIAKRVAELTGDDDLGF